MPANCGNSYVPRNVRATNANSICRDIAALEVANVTDGRAPLIISIQSI
jgi:hypothetical protein